MDTHFIIIATGYNCADKVAKCVQSVKNQTYQNFTAVFIDDGSEDFTAKVLHENIHSSSQLHMQAFVTNKGAAYRRYDFLQDDIHPESVVVLIGLDDELFPNALERIAQEYDKGHLMTYGNWTGSDGYTLPEGFLHYSDSIHRARYYRSVQFRATAVNTFKAHLFDHFTEDDFKFQGEWIKATTESNLMFSLLEMCGQSRIGVIEGPIYLYNNQRKDSAVKRFGREYQDKILKDAKKRPMRDLI